MLLLIRLMNTSLWYKKRLPASHLIDTFCCLQVGTRLNVTYSFVRAYIGGRTSYKMSARFFIGPERRN